MKVQLKEEVKLQEAKRPRHLNVCPVKEALGTKPTWYTSTVLHYYVT